MADLDQPITLAGLLCQVKKAFGLQTVQDIWRS